MRARWLTIFLACALVAAGGATAIAAVVAPPSTTAADRTALVGANQRHAAHVVPQAAAVAPRTVMKQSRRPVKVSPLVAGCLPGYGDPGKQCIPLPQKSRATCAWLAANGYLRHPLRVPTADLLRLDPRRSGQACR